MRVGWEQRGEKSYYYRSFREGNAVRKVYFGNGRAAQIAAEQDREARARRREERKRLQDFEGPLIRLDGWMMELHKYIRILTEATLLVGGLHEHHGMWRRKHCA